VFSVSGKPRISHVSLQLPENNPEINFPVLSLFPAPTAMLKNSEDKSSFREAS
jgi:hypothetical protein